MSKLYVKFAPMSSGKSLELLAKSYSFEERGIPFLCIKPKIDNRENDDIIKSRVGTKRKCIMISNDDNLYELIEKMYKKLTFNSTNNLMWVFIDECQFLTEKQVDELRKIVDEYEINVMCYGLRTDFRTNAFPGSLRLFEVADSIDELKSQCGCGRKAIFNARIGSDGNIVTNGEQIQIGGNEKYIALCSKCYHNAIENKLKNIN